MGNIKARVFVEEPINEGKQIVLKDKNYNYLVNVMRLKVGDSVALIDGKNGEFVGSVLAVEKRACIVGVGERMGSEPFLVYNKLLVIEILVQRDKMGYEEAMEFFNYNILGSYVGESTPVFITQL